VYAKGVPLAVGDVVDKLRPLTVTAPVDPLTDCTGARPIRLVAVTFLVVAVPATSSTIANMSAPAGLARSVSSVIFLLAMIFKY
jgi:hypothetical protein